MNKELRTIIENFEGRPFFTIADARKLTGVSRLSVSGVYNLLNEELTRANGRIGKISYGVYCVRKEIPGTGILYTTAGSDYVFEKYVGGRGKAKGYVTGLSFLNRIGYSDDIPGLIEVASNLEKSRGREVRIGSERAYLRRPYVRVTRKNVRILPVFDVLVRTSSPKDPNLVAALSRYLSSLGIKKCEVESVFKSLPVGSRERINLGGLLDGIVER